MTRRPRWWVRPLLMLGVFFATGMIFLVNQARMQQTPPERLPHLDTIRWSAAARADIEEDLSGSISDYPTLRLAENRIGAAGRIEWSLPKPSLRALVESSESWLRFLMEDTQYATLNRPDLHYVDLPFAGPAIQCEYAPRWGDLAGTEQVDEQCELMVTLVAALSATYTLLERTDETGELLAQFRDAIAAHALPFETAPKPCSPNDVDAVHTAALAHLGSLSIAPPPVHIAGARCVQVQTLGGWMVAEGERSADGESALPERPFVSIGTPTPFEYETYRMDRLWDDAPTVSVGFRASVVGGSLILKKVGGIWRVVAGGVEWIE